MKKIQETTGVFETMRAYHKQIAYFKQHLKRISRAAKLMKIKIPYQPAKFEDILQKKIKNIRLKDAYVKLTLSQAKPNARVSLEVKKYEPFSAREYKEGFSAMVSSFWKDESHPLAGIKTTDRLLYELSLHEAKAKGFDEALMLNSRGLIAEGTRANLFFVKNKVLHTPALTCGCLPGITRLAVFNLAKKNKIKIKEGNFTIHDLAAADEAFLTNSLIGIMPLGKIDQIKIGKGTNNMAQFLRKKYNRLLYGSKKD